MICIVTYVIGCLFQLYIYTHSCYSTVDRAIHTAYSQQSSMLLLVFAYISDYGPVCHVSHTSCPVESFPLCCLITHSSSQWTICYISQSPSSGCPFLLCLLITNSSLSWTVCPASHTQLNFEPCLMHPPSQMFCTLFDGFLHHRLRLWHRTQFHRRVSDRSVAFGPSFSSVYSSPRGNYKDGGGVYKERPSYHLQQFQPSFGVEEYHRNSIWYDFYRIFSFRANWFIGIDSYTPHFKGNKHDIISIALEPLGSYEWIPILP